jgi:hypothetical protein
MKLCAVIIVGLVLVSGAFAQHDHHMPMPSASPTSMPRDHQHGMPAASPSPTPGDMTGMHAADHAAHMDKMASTVNIGDPMNREASGTAWNPDSSQYSQK